jgi:hypothetical protein
MTLKPGSMPTTTPLSTKQTNLSSFIHKLKDSKTNFSIKWELMDSNKPFNPVTGICPGKKSHCLQPILGNPELNSRNEMFSSCKT